MTMREIKVSRTEKHKCTNICRWKYAKWPHKWCNYKQWNTET